MTMSEPTTDTEADKPNPPRSRKGVLTRARLLDAAKQIFEEHGFLDARISDIAERAGLSHGSFYHYFDSKEQIFREVAEAVYEHLAEPVGSVILAHSDSTPPERLREAIRRHFESYVEEARIIGVIEQVSRYDEHVRSVNAERARASRRLIAGSIRQMQERGLADPELDADLAPAILGSMTERFAEAWLVQGEIECDFDHAVEQVARAFINALGIREEAPRKIARRARRS